MPANVSQDTADFIKRNHVAVLATASLPSGTPHAAAVFYATDSHMNFYFLTKEQTTKSKNITGNPQAAMVIFEPAILRAVQITGDVYRVNNQEMMNKALRLMSKFSQQTAGTKVTPISKLDAGAYVLYCLSPQSIRSADYKYGNADTIFDVAIPTEESLDY